MARQVKLGFISGVYGVRGWMRVHSYTEPRDGILGYRQWTLSAPSTTSEQANVTSKQFEVSDGRRQGKGIVVQLAGIEDRDAATALIGQEIYVDREALPAAAEDEYYWSDLVGLEVTNESGERLGVVDHLIETGAHDVLVLEGGSNKLIPFAVPKIVQRVDLDAGIIVVKWDVSYWE